LTYLLRAEQAAEAEAARAEEAAAVTTARREAKMAALRAEPAAGPGVTTLLVRMPDGSRQPRRFNLTDSVKAVYDFVDTLDSLTCVRYRYAAICASCINCATLRRNARFQV